jgi:hypothetical protein
VARSHHRVFSPGDLTTSWHNMPVWNGKGDTPLYHTLTPYKLGQIERCTLDRSRGSTLRQWTPRWQVTAPVFLQVHLTTVECGATP